MNPNAIGYKRLKKPCEICNKKFQPSTKFERQCPTCFKIRRSFAYVQHCKKLKKIKDSVILNSTNKIDCRGFK